MPYKVFGTGSKSKPHCVYKLDDEGQRVGEPLGCHSSPAKAGAQVRALYAAEGQRKEHDRGKAAEIVKVYESLGLDKPSNLKKFNRGQRRDKRGRWSAGGIVGRVVGAIAKKKKETELLNSLAKGFKNKAGTSASLISKGPEGKRRQFYITGRGSFGRARSALSGIGFAHEKTDADGTHWFRKGDVRANALDDGDSAYVTIFGASAR